MNSHSNQGWFGVEPARVRRPGVYTYVYGGVSDGGLGPPTEQGEADVVRRVAELVDGLVPAVGVALGHLDRDRDGPTDLHPPSGCVMLEKALDRRGASPAGNGGRTDERTASSLAVNDGGSQRWSA